MRTFELHSSIALPRPLDDVFPFFSDARNLARLTPPWLRFVDEQRRGPYRLWIHEHRFEEKDGQTVARDDVRYAVPGGWLVDRLVVRRDLRRVFEYRRSVLRDLFGTAPEAPA